MKKSLIILFLLTSGWLMGQTTADFSADITEGCTPVLINFTNLSSPDATTFSWDFGNGNTSTQKNPSVLYSQPGVYEIKLTSTSGTGSDTEIKSSYISIYAPPKANFQADKFDICGSETVNFTDLSIPQSGSIKSKFWSFGDGNFSSSSDPSHNYSTEGEFTVYLLVEDENGCTDTHYKTDYISVNQPVADFSFDSIQCKTPLNVNFTNLSTGQNLAYEWEFGDGSTSTQTDPTKSFFAFDTIPITLIAQSQGSQCYDTIVKPLYLQPYEADFDYTVSCNQDDFTINFTNTSVVKGDFNFWQFGDGNDTIGGKTAQHTYTSTGNHTLKLITSYNATCKDTVTRFYQTPKADFITSNLPCQPPFDVNFVSQAQGTDISILWNFSNGNNSTVGNPQQNYPSALDSNAAVLTVTNIHGCSSSDTMRLNFPFPIAAFTVDSPAQGCAPITIGFTNHSSSTSGAIVSYEWDFGDPASGASNNSSLQNPSHLYSSHGQYDVRLIIENSAGCRDTAISIRGARAGEKPNLADFTMPADTICHHSTHQYFDASTYADPTVVSNYWCWAWYQSGGDLLDGNDQPPLSCPDSGYFGIEDEFVAIEDPFHDFGKWTGHNSTTVGDTVWAFDPRPDTGTYFVNMIVGNNGCYAETKKEMYIRSTMAMPNYVLTNGTLELGACEAPYSFGLMNGSYNYDTMTYFNVVHRESGDTIAIITDPNDTTWIVAQKSGHYDIRIGVENNTEGCSDSRVRTLSIDSIIPDVIIPKVGCVGERILMVNNSVSTYGDLDFRQWEFGDGMTIGVNNDSVYHVYTDTGTYVVELEVRSVIEYNYLGGNFPSKYICSTIITDTITIGGTFANFDVSDTISCVGNTIQFSDSASTTNSGLNWLWSFGDGQTSTSQHPSHSYSIKGTYSVQLITSDAQNCNDTLLKSSLILITKPNSEFTSNDSIACVGDSISFFNVSTGDGNLAYFWDLADGDTTSLENPGKVFLNSGFHKISLITTDENGCADTLAPDSLINIADYPNTNFGADTIYADCPPLPIFFNDSTDITISWDWDFGDGDGSNDQNPFHTYISPGKYDVRLITNNSNGCIDTLVKSQYVVIGGPIAAYSFDPDSGCAPVEIQFDVNATDAAYFVWDYGDGVVESFNLTDTDSALHTYNDGGLLNPVLEVIDTNNCNVILEDQILYIENIVAQFTQSDSLLCGFNTVDFNNTSTSYFNTVYEWDFGDNNNSSNENPTHLYNQQDTFDIRLIATSDLNCADTAYSEIVVFKSPNLKFDTLTSRFCIPVGIEFLVTNNATGVDISKWLWQHGTEQQDSSYALFVINDIGVHNFNFQLRYGNNSCLIDSTHTIQVYDQPLSDFDFDPEHPSVNSIVSFTDQSQNVTQWNWNFKDGSISSFDSPTHNFSKPGRYEVTLIGRNEGNCIDTIFKVIEISPGDIIKVPSAFSPNGDGYNDFLNVLYSGEVTLLEISIVNRWGQEVYKSDNLNEGWDGNFNGKPQDQGTYVYYLRGVDITTGKEVIQKGNITLIR